ncbi:hypothetical protein CHS0354_019840 [Potamilus streckersoni]|uniref:SAM domain-containing protein n=1 Tax=Potamilus streckersoni TaxID=2493646 RepID=A0AAE0SYQ1_9BIVA|nr:hypothetical protein CHS0354_019840 [Potamilus streckersoni]
MEPELCAFLRSIGCHDAIQIMEQKKLDLTVISYMSVDDLMQILPKLGDRIVLKVFLDEEIKKKQES